MPFCPLGGQRSLRHRAMGSWSDAGNVRGPTRSHPDRNGDLRTNRHPAITARRSDAGYRNLKDCCRSKVWNV